MTTIHDLPTPALLLDWPTAERNIRFASDLVKDRDVRLRPHFKNHKCVEIAKRQLAAGGCVGMTAATVAEARALLEGGVEDVLIANQVSAPAKIRQLIEIANKGVVRVAVDSRENAGPIAAAAREAGVEIGVLVEVDIGTKRCGLLPGEPALRLARDLQDMPGIRFDGLQAYHGHVIGVQDVEERRKAARSTIQLAIDTRRLIESEGIECGILSGMGSSTYRMVIDMEGVDELQVGTYPTMDWYYNQLAPEFDIALSVLVSVISVFEDRFVLDVGVKGVATEFGVPRFMGHPEFVIKRFVSEEHTIVPAENHGMKVGDRLHMIPSHACGTCNLHNQIVVRDGEKVMDVWPISARGYAVDPLP